MAHAAGVLSRRAASGHIVSTALHIDSWSRRMYFVDLTRAVTAVSGLSEVAVFRGWLFAGRR